jgi:DNA-binding NtrC family response regulator
MKKRILIVDDEPQIRTLLVQALKGRNFDTSAAASGTEAKRAVSDQAPDLIISDLQLEDTDGLQLIEEFRKSHPAIPVILLTGVLFDADTIRDTISPLVAAYIPKTASLKTILDEVCRICPP